MSKTPKSELRRGWTTGACATAATKAAFAALLTGIFPDPVAIRLPRGETPSFPLARAALHPDRAMAAIVKDAGDDPDVTHGATIEAELRLLPKGSGIRFRAGPGVGTVTRPGLPLPPGEPAINPAPRAMMQAVIAELAAAHGATEDVEIAISIPGGAEIAERTWNPRLGIEGGLSILGTTGIVHPYSCSAWIASIHRGIDVIRAARCDHAAACTGSTSEAAVKARYALPDFAFIDMGDFAGGMLKYLRRHPIARLSIAGGFGKLVKLAQGQGDLHSARSQVDFSRLAKMAEACGAEWDLKTAIAGANTAAEAIGLAQGRGLPLGDFVARAAQEQALILAEHRLAIEILAFDRNGKLIGHAPFAA